MIYTTRKIATNENLINIHLQNKHSTPEMKHKTKCRLVFALYQDNQADEAEKVIFISYVIGVVFTWLENFLRIVRM